MKKRNKLAVALLAVALLLCLLPSGSPAARAEGSEENAEIDSLDVSVTFHIDDPNRLLPKAQFRYTVEPAAGREGTEESMEIHAGVTMGAYFAPGEDVTTAWNSEGSKATTDHVKVRFDAKRFPHAGIYRYMLRQAPLTAEQVNQKIYVCSADQKSDARILDVIVGRNENGEQYVAAAVLYEILEEEGSDEIQPGKKAEGFENRVRVPDSPNTGDDSNSGIYAAALITAASFAAVTLFFLVAGSKRKKANGNASER